MGIIRVAAGMNGFELTDEEREELARRREHALNALKREREQAEPPGF